MKNQKVYWRERYEKLLQDQKNAAYQQLVKTYNRLETKNTALTKEETAQRDVIAEIIGGFTYRVSFGTKELLSLSESLKTNEIKVILVREDNEELLNNTLVSKHDTDHYGFTSNDTARALQLMWFNHNQHHTRLDVSELEDHLLISFDADLLMVGITYCGNRSLGPYILHNKQRYFLIARRDAIVSPEKIRSFRFD